MCSPFVNSATKWYGQSWNMVENTMWLVKIPFFQFGNFRSYRTLSRDTLIVKATMWDIDGLKWECAFLLLSFNIPYRNLSHFSSCGRAVCASCSSHSYMETSDGVARTRKACTDCYCKMHSTPTPLTPSSHLTTSNGGGSGCPDGESTPTRSPYVSPSQAVRG